MTELKKFIHLEGRKCGNSQNALKSSNFSDISCFSCIGFYLKINLDHFLNQVDFKEYRYNSSNGRGQHNFLLLNYNGKNFRTFNNLKFPKYEKADFNKSNQTIFILEKQTLQMSTPLMTYEKAINYLSSIVDDVEITTKIIDFELFNKKSIKMLVVRSNIGRVLTEGFIRFACQVGDRLMYNEHDMKVSIKKVYTETQQTNRMALKPLGKIWASNKIEWALNNTDILIKLKSRDKEEHKLIFNEYFQELNNRLDLGFSASTYKSLNQDIKDFIKVMLSYK